MMPQCSTRGRLLKTSLEGCRGYLSGVGKQAGCIGKPKGFYSITLTCRLLWEGRDHWIPGRGGGGMFSFLFFQKNACSSDGATKILAWFWKLKN